jgi:hypothetical protein
MDMDIIMASDKPRRRLAVESRAASRILSSPMENSRPGCPRRRNTNSVYMKLRQDFGTLSIRNSVKILNEQC